MSITVTKIEPISATPTGSPLALECIHYGDQVGVSTWHHCNHPDTPLGATVCKCNGCGPTCPGYPNGPKTWAYGVTTVPSRRETYLPRTLNSLLEAGFDKPRLFVDGDSRSDLWEGEFSLEMTCRSPKVGTVANWYMSLLELYVRDPFADLYAMFQDDFVTYRGLREYLEKVTYPDNGYLNLYTFPSNQGMCPPRHKGWFKSNQLGRGAVALVFNQPAVRQLLSAKHMIKKMGSSELIRDRPARLISVDGGIVTAMATGGIAEYVHNPSLVQHIGHESSMGNKPHMAAEWWRGEDFDATQLL